MPEDEMIFIALQPEPPRGTPEWLTWAAARRRYNLSLVSAT